MSKFLITVFLVIIANVLNAQNTQEAKRKEFLFGASLGVNTITQQFPNKTLNSSGMALDFKVGYMIKPNIALLLTSNVSVYNYSGVGRDRKRDFGVLAPAVQYWFNKRWYVMVGAGIGVDAPVFFDVKEPDNDKHETIYYSGFGAVGAVGYEVYTNKRFNIDVKARVSYRNVNIAEGNTNGISSSLLLGFNF